MITVKELKEQLMTIERLGLGDAQVWFKDWNDIDHKIEYGIDDADEKKVVLG